MKKFSFKLNNKKYSSSEQCQTGEEILEIVGLTPPEDYELFLKIGGREFEPVQLNEKVDLSQPGLEKFKVKRRFEIPYCLDDEFYSTYECLVTPLQLLQANGYDPQKFYLKQLDGHIEINYKDDLEHEISLRPNMKFITCKKSPTPVSFVNPIGIQCIEGQLKELGYEVTKPRQDMVAFNFEVPHGRFKGKQIEVAIHAPQFPNIAPTGIYIKPHLMPLQNGGTHPTGGIHNRNMPTNEWQYWSRPIRDWNTTDKTMKTYLSFIRTLFDFK